MSPRQVILIGAARSGTKMLRGALATATGAGMVPYDIGYVWRHGNERLPDDVIEPTQVGERSRHFIRTFIEGYAAGDVPTVIEKTVGNTMRVPLVASVFPEAKFIHLIRDGVDVAESSRRQWTADTDWRYVAAKLRHVPLRLLPRFGAGYVGSKIRRAVGHDQVPGSWGPRYPGIDADLTAEELLVVCARQWKESVELATKSFAVLDAPVYDLRYEELVSDPLAQLRELTEFLGSFTRSAAIEEAALAIKGDRVGSGRTALSPAELEVLQVELSPTNRGLGYHLSTTVIAGQDQRKDRGSS